MTQPPPSGKPLELTLRVIVLGLVLSVVMGAANVYLGLKAGMTVSASIPAAVIGMLVLRTVFRGGTILEANQIQTAASAGESLAAGIIFTMPALVLIGVWKDFDWVMTTAIAFTGGLLGILFMIPMRRVFVISDNEELKYPEGVACAAVLEAGDSAEGEDSGADAVVKGALAGALVKLLIDVFGVVKGVMEGAIATGGRVFCFGSEMLPALVSVGFIVRLNVSVLLFAGGAIGWFFGIPLLGDHGGVVSGAGEDGLVDAAYDLWSSQIRYVGVGTMVVGGIATIWRVRGSLVDAVKMIRGGQSEGEDGDLDRNLPTPVIVALSILAIFLVGAIYLHLTGSLLITVPTTLLMVTMSLFFTAVASYIVGLVGNSNSPVSGMTITAVLFTGGLLYLFGFRDQEGMLATLGVAAVVCCVACTSGDVCNDLKTGQMVGASPFRQQIMQILGVAAACLVMAPVLQILHDQTEGGIGGPNLSAPQASLFASLAEGFFGEEKLPWNMIYWGVGLGFAILALDRFLEVRKAPFRAYIMPIAVGIYLPLSLSTPMLVGGLISWFLLRGTTSEEEREKKSRRGILLASGIIAGEALTGVGRAMLAAAGAELDGLNLGEGAGWVLGSTWVVTLLFLGFFVQQVWRQKR